MARMGIWGLVLALAACGRVGFAPGDGVQDVEAGLDASADGAVPDGSAVDVWMGDVVLGEARVDAGPMDAGLTDSGPADGALVDSAMDAGPGCGVSLDSNVLALFSMENLANGSELDRTGDHTMTIEGNLPTTSGPDGCGTALVGSTLGYGMIPADPDWQIFDGSVDFYVRLPSPPSSSRQGVLSRDAVGSTQSGHLGVYYMPTGGLVVRIQSNGDHYICAEGPLPTSQWMHVGINLGSGVELWIDGQRQSYTGSISFGSGTETCELSPNVSINGNDNPWVVGAHSEGSSEGSATPVNGHFPGTIDELRISNVRRDFSQFAESGGGT